MGLQDEKGVICIDDVDKIFSPNEYSNSVRTEVFSLLDYRIPDGAIPLCEPNPEDAFGGNLDEAALKDLIKFDVEEKLKDRFLTRDRRKTRHQDHVCPV